MAEETLTLESVVCSEHDDVPYEVGKCSVGSVNYLIDPYDERAESVMRFQLPGDFGGSASINNATLHATIIPGSLATALSFRVCILAATNQVIPGNRAGILAAPEGSEHVVCGTGLSGLDYTIPISGEYHLDLTDMLQEAGAAGRLASGYVCILFRVETIQPGRHHWVEMGGVAAPTLTLDYAEPEPPLVTHEGTGLLVVGPSDYDILVSEIPVWLSATRQLSDVVRSMQVVDLPVEITCQRKLSDTTRTAYVDELPIDVVCARQLPDTVRTMYVSEVVTAVTGTGLLIVDPIGYDIVLRKVTDTIPDRRLIPSGLFAESYNPRGLLV